MSRSEKAILNDTLVAVSSLPESLIWRNNTGQGWQGRRVNCRPGQTIEVVPGMMILLDARPISFGLVGSGDAIGAVQGRAVAIETKAHRGSQRDEQRSFERTWTKAGGLYVLGRSADEIVERLIVEL